MVSSGNKICTNMIYFAIFILEHIVLSESICAMRILRSTSLPIFVTFVGSGSSLLPTAAGRDRDVHSLTSRAHQQVNQVWNEMARYASRSCETAPDPTADTKPLVFRSSDACDDFRPSDDLIKKRRRVRFETPSHHEYATAADLAAHRPWLRDRKK